MKLVVDTNVIVSGLLISSSNPALILGKILDGSFSILYDNRILAEYTEVLYRDKLKINKEAVSYIIEYIKNDGIFIISTPYKLQFTDESDKKFYEVYKSANADYLITGNLKHFPKENGIVTPKEFLDHRA